EALEERGARLGHVFPALAALPRQADVRRRAATRQPVPSLLDPAHGRLQRERRNSLAADDRGKVPGEHPDAVRRRRQSPARGNRRLEARLDLEVQARRGPLERRSKTQEEKDISQALLAADDHRLAVKLLER